ncbi:MAG: sulfite exporter TauE/SafE family protein [Alphaproteobacteria bacterium]
MFDFTLLGQDSGFWLVAVVAVLIMGVSKGGFGSGMNVASTPLLALASNPILAAAIMLPLLNIMDLLGIRAFWRQWDIRTARSLLLPMIAGVVLGIILFTSVNADWLRILLAVVVYVVLTDRWGLLRRVGLMVQKAKETPEPGGPMAWILGTLLGVTSTIAHAGGPAGSAYLLRFNFDKTTFQATTILTFTAVNLIKLPFYLFTGQFPLSTLAMTGVLVPVAVVSMLLGVVLHRIMPQRPFFIFMEAALFVTACKLMWDGVTGLLG